MGEGEGEGERGIQHPTAHFVAIETINWHWALVCNIMIYGSKSTPVLVLVPVVISNNLRVAPARRSLQH